MSTWTLVGRDWVEATSCEGLLEKLGSAGADACRPLTGVRALPIDGRAPRGGGWEAAPAFQAALCGAAGAAVLRACACAAQKLSPSTGLMPYGGRSERLGGYSPGNQTSAKHAPHIKLRASCNLGASDTLCSVPSLPLILTRTLDSITYFHRETLTASLVVASCP